VLGGSLGSRIYDGTGTIGEYNEEGVLLSESADAILFQCIDLVDFS
jgi:hypothetical protein